MAAFVTKRGGGLKGQEFQNSLFGDLVGDKMTRGTNGTSDHFNVAIKFSLTCLWWIYMHLYS